MKKINLLPYILFSILLFILLLFPNQSIIAVKEGLLLWFNVIIPTLFPFMILSYIILHSPIIDFINKIFAPIFNKVFHLSGVASYALIVGILSGYPMGAVIVSDLVKTKKITKKEGNYLLKICNNPSPMFIIGFVASALLYDSSLGVPFLISIFLGNLLTAIIFKKETKGIEINKILIKKNYENFSFSYFDECIAQTAAVLLKVGGYIIFFSLPIILLSELYIDNIGYRFLISTIDLSNGAKLLSHLSCPLKLKYALIASLTAFGSLSVVGQTASVIKGSGLSIKNYFLSKIINGFITFICAFLVFSIMYN